MAFKGELGLLWCNGSSWKIKASSIAKAAQAFGRSAATVGVQRGRESDNSRGGRQRIQAGATLGVWLV